MRSKLLLQAKCGKICSEVMRLYDREDVSALTENECAAVIEIASLRNQRTEIELESAYFRGCYDSVGYLKKAGIL